MRQDREDSLKESFKAKNILWLCVGIRRRAMVPCPCCFCVVPAFEFRPVFTSYYELSVVQEDQEPSGFHAMGNSQRLNAHLAGKPLRDAAEMVADKGSAAEIGA